MKCMNFKSEKQNCTKFVQFSLKFISFMQKNNLLKINMESVQVGEIQKNQIMAEAFKLFKSYLKRLPTTGKNITKKRLMDHIEKMESGIDILAPYDENISTINTAINQGFE